MKKNLEIKAESRNKTKKYKRSRGNSTNTGITGFVTLLKINPCTFTIPRIFVGSSK